MREYTDEEMKTILRSVNCGYGPERTDFTMKDPAGYITFNSIIDNPAVGNERNFVRVKEYNSDKPFHNIVCVRPDYEYEIYIYFHNDAMSKLNASGEGIAHNTRIQGGFKKRIINKDNPSLVYATIRCKDANPPEIWDGAVLATDSEEDIELLYVTDSLKIYSGDVVQPLPKDDFFNNPGALIGRNPENKLNGDVYACAEYSGYIKYRLHAVLVKEKHKIMDQVIPNPNRKED